MLKNIGTEIVETKRLILRRYTINDKDDMFNNWTSDEEVSKFLAWKPHKSVDETKSILESWILEYENMDRYHWGIEIKSNNQVIGDIAVFNLKENHCSCEIGYCLSRQFWNRGIMTEALSGVIDFLFKKVGLNRIVAMHNVNNIQSGKVMIKSNMKYEGTLREANRLRDEDGFYNLAVYSILKSEWENMYAKQKEC
ncbi:GNAT family acetyltransferase [Paraclostridium benzoelyticum]|uniref:GNAT family acetyltransferase n=1 Tax=Paraclostridium benzoelyticum TaxID=1629550 RepID=A0A0M3DGD8_9FIRM|nr:GNAT family N-acetyltransferase [Paraclostridium benzoelyticum]KKY01695.1 GNAT family acetyltransferase [Paraclostridium benzoelyticum]OXX83218.1 GNAT family acetyltransferase [Paraclostridium benzoelyticum]